MGVCWQGGLEIVAGGQTIDASGLVIKSGGQTIYNDGALASPYISQQKSRGRGASRS